MDIPPPSDWREFEQIALTSLKTRWGSPNLTHNGRQGQKQSGVDIYGKDDLGRFVAVQCKREKTVTKQSIEAEIRKAESFEPPLSAFYIATTAAADAILQRQVRLLSEKRIRVNKFPVGIFFWEDLLQDLVKNEAQLRKHYPQLQLRDSAAAPRMLCILDIAYFGLHIESVMRIIFGQWGVMVNEDPQQIETMLKAVAASGATLFDTRSSVELNELCTKLSEHCLAYVSDEVEPPNGLLPAITMAKKIAGTVSKVEYTLVGKELAVFALGRILGYWNSRIKSEVSVATEEDLIKFFRALKPDKKTTEAFCGRLKLHRKSKGDFNIHKYGTAHSLYHIVRRMISHIATS